MIINHKGTRMAKDGEDCHRLQTTKLKSLAKLFKPFNRDYIKQKKSQAGLTIISFHFDRRILCTPVIIVLCTNLTEKLALSGYFSVHLKNASNEHIN